MKIQALFQRHFPRSASLCWFKWAAKAWNQLDSRLWMLKWDLKINYNVDLWMEKIAISQHV